MYDFYSDMQLYNNNLKHHELLLSLNKFLLFQGCLLNLHCIHYLKILRIVFYWMYIFYQLPVVFRLELFLNFDIIFFLMKIIKAPTPLSYKMVSALCDIIFSSPGPKGHVSFCHHFASVGVVVRICKLFIFSSSSLKPLNRFGPNLAEMLIGRSSTRFVILVQIGNPTWLPGPIMCSDWLKIFLSETTQPMEL